MNKQLVIWHNSYYSKHEDLNVLLLETSSSKSFTIPGQSLLKAADLKCPLPHTAFNILN